MQHPERVRATEEDRVPGDEVPAPSRAWTAAIDAFVDHLVLQRDHSEHTVAAYRRDATDLATFCTGLGIEHPDEVELLVLRRYLADLAERGYARATIARRASAVRTLHRFLARDGIVSRDVSRLLGTPKQGRTLPRVLRPDQVVAVLTAPDTATPAGLRDRALLEVLYATGARVSEACGLDLGAVDLSQGLVRLFGKGRKERIVPLGDPARDALDAYLAGGRPHLAGAGGPGRAAPQRPRRPARHPGRAHDRRARRSCRRGRPRHPAHAPAQLRHPPPRGRRGPTCGPGAPRPRVARDHPALHAPVQRAARRGLHDRAPARGTATERR